MEEIKEKIEVIGQGKCIIERDPEDDGFWIMTPDVQVEYRRSRAFAEAVCRMWFRKMLGNGSKIGIGKIEWRK